MSGVADRCKRHDAAGKRTERCDTIPWSQQVDEAFYENLNSSTDNIDSDLKIKCRNPFSDKDSRRPEESNNENKRNLQKVSCNGQKISTPNVHKDFNEAEAATRSKVESASISSESKLNRKKITWASIASQPAKPNKKNYNVMLKKKGPGMPPPPMVPGKHNLDSNAWEFSNNMTSAEACGTVPISIPVSNPESSSEDFVAPNSNRPIIIDQQQYSYSRKQQPNAYSYKPKNVKTNSRIDFSQDQRFIEKHNEEEYHNTRKANMNCPIVHKESVDKESAQRSICGEQNLVSNDESPKSDSVDAINIVLKKLKDRNNYNPVEIDLQKAALSRFFVIKSYSEDDIHRSIKYEIWCSTDHGNKRLDEAFKERVKEGGNVMLFFSVNGSGHFCGMAQMMTSVDYNSTSSVWSQDKWKGKFKVKWIYVKDVPNSQLRHIRLENNDNKSVTNSRDTQEVPNSKGLQVLKVLHLFKHQTSIFDDFYHYEKKQEEAVVHKKPTQFDNYVQQPPAPSNTCNNDLKEQNTDRVSGNFKERTMFHRGGNKNFSGNRQYDLSNDMDKDERERSAYFMNKDREKIKSNAAGLYRHTNSCSERSSNSKRNFNDIMHINNINYNEHNIAGENAETKMS